MTELKIRALSIAEIVGAVNGELVQSVPTDVSVESVTIDSRDKGRNMLFFAIKGERFDGHDFAASAVENGAVCLVCRYVPQNVAEKNVAVILVPDPVKALGALASYYRSLTDVRIVAVTGSVGKTTTKEFIHAVLSQRHKTHKTAGNFNNHLGLPLTLLALSPDDRAAVVEMGMSARGEISYLSSLARPDIAVITNIGSSHLEHLGTRENICLAKLEIVDGLASDGVLLVNGDEPLLSAADSRYPHVLRFAQNDDADCRAVNVRSWAGGIAYDLVTGDRLCKDMSTGALGNHNVYNSLVACAVGLLFDMTEEEIRAGLLAFQSAAMRQNIYLFDGITVMEDCYNASPESVRASLDVLVSLPRPEGGRCAALLGDMLELGADSRRLHSEIGVYAGEKKVDLLFVYGPTADAVAEAAVSAGIPAENVCVWHDVLQPEGMAQRMDAVLREGDALLVKASRGIAAEKVLACYKDLRARRTKNHED